MRISDWSSDVCSSDLWTATNSDLLKAVSIASVQMEPAYYWFNARPGRETFAENVRKTWGAGSPDETPELWKTLYPALNVDRIHAPILMQFPEQDARLSIRSEERRVGQEWVSTSRSPWLPHQ